METPDGTRWRGEARDMATGQIGNVGNSDFWTPEQAMQQCAVAAGVNFWRPWDNVQVPGDWLARYRRDPGQCAADMVVAGCPRIAVARWCEAVGAADLHMLRLYDAALGGRRMILHLTTRRGLAYLFTARASADTSASNACGKVEFQIDARCWTVQVGPYYLARPASDAG